MRLFILKFSTAILLFLISGFCMYFGLAEFYYQKANDKYSQMNISNLRVAKQLKPISIDLDYALGLRGSHANALDLKADLLYQSWWLSPDGQYLDSSDYLQEAVEHHLNSLKIRQGWVFAISRLALIHSHQQELDEKFDYWFAQSHRLGLYETRVARSLMEVGLQNWHRITVDQQVVAMDFIRVSIEQKSNSPQYIAKLLQRYQKQEFICRELAYSPRKKMMCDVS